MLLVEHRTNESIFGKVKVVADSWKNEHTDRDTCIQIGGARTDSWKKAAKSWHEKSNSRLRRHHILSQDYFVRNN